MSCPNCFIVLLFGLMCLVIVNTSQILDRIREDLHELGEVVLIDLESWELRERRFDQGQGLEDVQAVTDTVEALTIAMVDELVETDQTWDQLKHGLHRPGTLHNLLVVGPGITIRLFLDPTGLDDVTSLLQSKLRVALLLLGLVRETFNFIILLHLELSPAAILFLEETVEVLGIGLHQKTTKFLQTSVGYGDFRTVVSRENRNAHVECSCHRVAGLSTRSDADQFPVGPKVRRVHDSWITSTH
jgi:hypothetical protein